jgi:hypothetical protein
MPGFARFVSSGAAAPQRAGLETVHRSGFGRADWAAAADIGQIKKGRASQGCPPLFDFQSAG